MAGESLLKQVFTETGVQLDRIIDAYKRNNGSYVPTGFPIYYKITKLTRDEYANPGEWFVIKLENIENPSSEFVIGYDGYSIRDSEWSEFTSFYIEYYTNPWSIYNNILDETIANISFEPFSITNLEPNDYLVEFVDPSTLPQS